MADKPEAADTEAPDTIEPVDLRADMAAVADEIEAREATERGEEPPARADGRDERGRFARRETTETPAAEAPAEAAAAPVSADTQAPAAAFAPPEDWPAEVKAKWPALPPELQRFAAEQTTAVRQQLATQAQQIDDINRAIGPDLNQFIQTHGSVAAGVSRLANAARWLGTDPVGFVQWVIGQARLTPQQIFQQQAPQPAVDPQLAPLYQTVTGLQHQVQQFQQQQQQAQYTAINDQIEAFAKDKPHFAALEPMITQVMTGGLARTLPEAYDKALALSPEIQAKLAAEKQAADKAEADKKAEAAKKARRIAETNVTSRGGSVTQADTGDMRATLRQALMDREARLGS